MYMVKLLPKKMKRKWGRTTITPKKVAAGNDLGDPRKSMKKRYVDI